jgi:uncharacterized membrane protein HdeD (DUF308 family)
MTTPLPTAPEPHPLGLLPILRHNWGWFVALGVLLMLFGVVGVMVPLVLGEAVVLLLGWLFLVGGIFEIVHAIWRRGWHGFWIDILSGILTTVIGGMILSRPGEALVDITLLIGIVFLVGGIFRFAVAVAVRNPYGPWIVLHGLIGIVLGLMILGGWPFSSIWVIGTLVGIDMVFNGARLITLGMAGRRSAAHAHPA